MGPAIPRDSLYALCSKWLSVPNSGRVGKSGVVYTVCYGRVRCLRVEVLFCPSRGILDQKRSPRVAREESPSLARPRGASVSRAACLAFREEEEERFSSSLSFALHVAALVSCDCVARRMYSRGFAFPSCMSIARRSCVWHCACIRTRVLRSALSGVVRIRVSRVSR